MASRTTASIRRAVASWRSIAMARAPCRKQHEVDASPTNVIVLREGRVYFEGAADELLHSSDEYLKTFLASAE